MKSTATLLALGLAWSVGFGAGQGAAAETAGTAYVGQNDCDDCQQGNECDECQRGHRKATLRSKYRRFHRRFREAHRWPEPYSQMAKASVRELFAAQVTKGWTRETTLYDYHFDPDTNELNRAGRRRVQHLTQQIRPDRRFIYVQAADTQADTQDRVAQVRNSACALIGADNCPPINVVHTYSRGARADELIRIRKLLINSTPVPRIQSASGAGGRTGGTGGGAGVSAGGMK